MEGAMKALRKNTMVAEPAAVMTRFAGYGAAANENPAATEAAPPVIRTGNRALLVAAPVAGLAYVLAFPVIGLALMAWMAIRLMAKRLTPVARFARNVALFLAAPFIGLAYALAFPFVGIGMLAWKGTRAMAKR
jgi:hypothetical protein